MRSISGSTCWETIIPDYAVTSNGGNILVRGVVDQQWRALIGRLVERNSAAAEEVGKLVRSVVRPEWIINERYCDELFYTFMVYRGLLPLDEINHLAERLLGLGWKVSLQGRKLYVVPEAVNKSDAIVHVRRTVHSEPMVASGIPCWTNVCWRARIMPLPRGMGKYLPSSRPL